MLKSEPLPEVPHETKLVARAAFPKGNVYMQMRDELGVAYQDEDFKDLYSAVGQPTVAPWRLALVCIMQFAANLTDRQTADAVRSRIDWKYTLSLDLTDAGFDFSVLSEFRGRLVQGQAEERVLDKLLALFQARGRVKSGGRQRTDATHVVAAVHALGRVELVSATLQHTLEQPAKAYPDWLKAHVPQEWFTRYEKKLDDYRLPGKPAERRRMAQTVGQDGQVLLKWVNEPDAPAQLQHLPAILTLQQVWQEQYVERDGQLHWRTPQEMPRPGQTITSPHDTDARFRMKRDTAWIGY